MSLIIGFFTFILVMNCLFLILLVLIQLPKKEAGAGIAFGGAATDALFGPGSGNALTKMTKYSATFFVGLSILLSVLNMQAAKQSTRRLEQEISKQASTPPARVTPALPSSNATAQAAVSAATSAVQQTIPTTAATNSLITTATNQASATITTSTSAAPAVATPAPATPPAPAPAK